MKLSIIIPEYQQNQYYLKRAIDSIASQEKVDFTQIEVILAIDGIDIITFPLPPFVKVIQSVDRLGCGKIREFALHYVQGEWVYFFDSDDTFFTPISLWYILDKISNAKTETKMMEFSFYNELENNIISSNTGSLYSHIYKKDTLDYFKMGFIDAQCYEDICFITTLINLVSYNNIEQHFQFPIYYYRNIPTSITKQPKLVKDEYKVKCDLLNLNYRVNKCKEYNIEPYDYLYIFAMLRLYGYGYSKGILVHEINRFIKENNILELAVSRDWRHIYSQFHYDKEQFKKIILTYRDNQYI